MIHTTKATRFTFAFVLVLCVAALVSASSSDVRKDRSVASALLSTTIAPAIAHSAASTTVEVRGELSEALTVQRSNATNFHHSLVTREDFQSCSCLGCNCNGSPCPQSISAFSSYATGYNVPYGASYISINAQESSGNGLDVYVTNSAGYAQYQAGNSFNYYPSYSGQSVSCLQRSGLGSTSDPGLYVIVRCGSMSTCRVRYTYTITANSPPSPPPTRPSGGGGGGGGSNDGAGRGCNCYCCSGNFCSPSFIGKAQASCNSCDATACASAFPGTCPATGQAGSSRAVCSSNASSLHVSMASIVASLFIALSLLI